MKKKMVRAGVISEMSGLPTGVIDRLADRGVIPFLRPDSAGNRYFPPDEVMAVLGLDAPKPASHSNINTQEVEK